jgi:dolichyl-phosphate-mannose--protein O-mannosyl transferase
MGWGSGSHMQIVTGVAHKDDYDSLWLIKESHNNKIIETGIPVKCDDIIRLEHINTRKNLHSHTFPSWITDSQEVCAFGDNGNGDINDNWKIICYNYKETEIKGKTDFFLYHMGTQQYMYMNIKRSLFNEHNCRNCPIQGHREVSCTTTKDKQALWKIIGGLIYKSNENEQHVHINSDL